MNFTRLALDGLVLIDPDVFEDERGFFLESWNLTKFATAGIDARFVQDNHSRSLRGTLRGLHYQLRHPQGKLVRVTVGEVFDVVVDIRRSSPTLGQWVSVELSAANRSMLWMPPGFAHGFYVTTPEAEFQYKCTQFYAPDDERSIQWNDPDLAISWPLVANQPPLISARDAHGTPFRHAELLA